MENSNHTKGEWSSNGLYIITKDGKQIGQTFMGNLKYDRVGRQIKDDEGEENAKAIATAVNNTYGKGINPEAVEDLLESLRGIVVAMERQGAKESSNNLFKKAKQAIEKATK